MLELLDIKKATFKQDYSIDVEFEDGLTGVVKVKKSCLVNAFEPLNDINLFLDGYVKYGTVMWDTGDYELDFAPDTIYAEIKKKGICVIK